MTTFGEKWRRRTEIAIALSSIDTNPRSISVFAYLFSRAFHCLLHVSSFPTRSCCVSVDAGCYRPLSTRSPGQRNLDSPATSRQSDYGCRHPSITIVGLLIITTFILTTSFNTGASTEQQQQQQQHLQNKSPFLLNC